MTTGSQPEQVDLPPSASRKALDRGFVLLTVLGALLMLAIIASTLMSNTRTQIKVRSVLETRAELMALADGLTRLAAFRLTERSGAGTASDDTPLDGTPLACRDADVVAVTRITDTTGQIDLNASSVDGISVLLRGLGVETGAAVQLAAELQRFREPSFAADGNDPLASTYREAGKPSGPKRGPFESVDELDQVLGFTPELVARMRPFVTIYSRTPAIDPNVAPIQLLEMIAAVNKGFSTSGDLKRNQIRMPSQFTARPNLRGSNRSRASAFAIDVAVFKGEKARFDRNAVVELTQNSEFGFAFREWTSRPNPLQSSVVRGDSLPACETVF